jgi:hypothetical protein
MFSHTSLGAGLITAGEAQKENIFPPLIDLLLSIRRQEAQVPFDRSRPVDPDDPPQAQQEL